MTDDSALQLGHTTIHTGGGDAVAGSKHIHGDFVGRDLVNNVTINVSSERLGELATLLASLLSRPGAVVRAGAVTADGQTEAVPPELFDALRQYGTAVPGRTQAERTQ